MLTWNKLGQNVIEKKTQLRLMTLDSFKNYKKKYEALKGNDSFKKIQE